MLSDKREERLIKGVKFGQYRAKALGYDADSKKNFLITFVFPEGYESTLKMRLADLNDRYEEQQFLDWVYVHIKRNNYFLISIEKFNEENELKAIRLRLCNGK